MQDTFTAEEIGNNAMDAMKASHEWIGLLERLNDFSRHLADAAHQIKKLAHRGDEGLKEASKMALVIAGGMRKLAATMNKSLAQGPAVRDLNKKVCCGG